MKKKFCFFTENCQFSSIFDFFFLDFGKSKNQSKTPEKSDFLKKKMKIEKNPDFLC